MPTIPKPDAATLAKWKAKGLIPAPTQRKTVDPTSKREKPARKAKTRQMRRNAKRRGMTEAQWQRQVIDFATLHGWEVYHVPDSRRVTCVGFPDLVMMHPTRPNPLIAAELKREKQKPRLDQEIWLQAFRLAGVPAFVWRPSDWTEVVKILSG